MKKRFAVLTVIAVVAGLLFWRFFGSTKTPPGQQAMAILNAKIRIQ